MLEMRTIYHQLRKTKRDKITWGGWSHECDWRGCEFVAKVIEEDFAEKIMNRAIKRAREEYHKAKRLAEEAAENARLLVPGE